MTESILFTNSRFEGLRGATEKYGSVFVLVDNNTKQHCYPLVYPHLPEHHIISILPGEEHKALKACIYIWYELTRHNADRKAVLINMGGGVIGDMGGFAAGCYKRGIDFINLPTTLLAMVDASVGGKTGIDFEGFKNQLGLFNQPAQVWIYSGFLKTQPVRELLSGFAEVIKHYLIADGEEFLKLAENLPEPGAIDLDDMIKKNIAIKQSFVTRDPHEKNVRKALNFGHTIGHAVESYFMQPEMQPLLHGEAVAAGILAESYISAQTGKLGANDLALISRVIKHYFRLPALGGEAIQKVHELMLQDKKNENGRINFTLLHGLGNFSVNNTVENTLIEEALKFYNTQWA